MPIYEYYCPDNHRLYSFFARSLQLKDRVPRCPDNPQYRMRKIVSSFAVTRGLGDEGGAAGDMDDPRVDAAMAQLEQEMGCIDPDNPDPRQMAHLMRRMQDISGEKLPAPILEMMGRMEAGESLDALEEEYADALDDESILEGGDSGSTRRLLDQVRQQPRRDPTLYELADYLDD